MGMNGGGSDQQVCCVLGICCNDSSDPNSKRVKTLAEIAQHALPWLTPDQAGEVAHWIARNWDLAPQGTLYAYTQAVAKIARGSAYSD